MFDAIAQAASDSSVKEISDWAMKGVLGFACLFVWRTQMLLVELRTLLTHPETGVLAQMKTLAQRQDGNEDDTTKHSSRLDVHGTRLDGHDKDIDELNEDRRHFKRRASDRERDSA